MFELENHSGKRKGTCPKCEKTRVFVYYKNLDKDLNFGRCDRQNHCGYHNKPNHELLKDQNIDFDSYLPKQEMIKATAYPNDKDLSVLKDLSSVFHDFCRSQLKITNEHLQKWNVGTCDNKYKNTVFGYKSKKQFLNLKTIAYQLTQDGKDCKRNKKSNPYYMKAEQGVGYKRCLYGEHLLSNNVVCLVESEKTAVIASFIYPQFDFLATGGSSGIKLEQMEKIKRKTVNYLADNDLAGKENSTIKHLKTLAIDFKIIEFPDAKTGEDLADMIIRNERPEIEPNMPQEPETKAEIPKINAYTIFKDYLLKTWDFRYNIVRNEMEYKFTKESDFIDLKSADIWVNLKENDVQFKKDDFNAILGSSIMQNYNPVEDYFKNLQEWDKQEDHIEKLISYIKFKGEINIHIHFKKWLVRAVKCAIDNKYFNKQIFVLVGKQNDGKSTFVRFLVPTELEKYYSENPDFKNKDGEISLSQNFIINMDELANIGRQDTDKLKTFISKISTNVRRPFERNNKTESRKASFMGTTNNDEFLTDHTGNVRWLNFKIDGIDFDYSKTIDINEVWSQAYSLLKSGFDCEISKQEMQEIEINNKEFKIQTVEMLAIKEFFTEPRGQSESELEFMQPQQIIAFLERNNPNFKSLSPVRLGRAMVSLGYLKDTKRIKERGHAVKGYWVSKEN